MRALTTITVTLVLAAAFSGCLGESTPSTTTTGGAAVAGTAAPGTVQVIYFGSPG